MVAISIQAYSNSQAASQTLEKKQDHGLQEVVGFQCLLTLIKCF